MAFSWDDELGRSGKEIGVITFKKLNKGNLMDDISITEGRIQAEAYDVKGITKNIVMLAVGSWKVTNPLLVSYYRTLQILSAIKRISMCY